MRRYRNKMGYRLWAMGYGLWLLPLASCLSPVACFNALAEDKAAADRNQPITITSNSMEARKNDNMVIFKGNVIAEQNDYTLYSKELYVYYADGQEIKEMVAIGDVKIVQLNKVATGEKAVYTRGEGTVVLTGNPQVVQDCDVVRGEKITVYLDEDKSFVEGGADKRVKAVVNPKDEKNKTKCK